ncbi:MAG: hypothetical protein ACRCSN_17120 [Dermatophilaceae bacterium]
MAGSSRRREAARAAAAVVLAAAGGAVALMAPDAVGATETSAVGTVWTVGAWAGVVAAALVVVDASFGAAGRPARAFSTAAVVLGWAAVLWLVLGGLFAVIDGAAADAAVGVGFIVAIPAAGAVVLALMSPARRSPVAASS